MGSSFIGGLLGAAGDDIEKKEQREYDEAKAERTQKRRLVELAGEAAIQRGLYNELPNIIGELDDYGAPSGAPKGMKDSFKQMGGFLAKHLLQRKQRQQQQGQQQQARTDVQGAPGVTGQPATILGQPQGQPAAPVSRGTPPLPSSVFERMGPEMEAGDLRRSGAAARQTFDIAREEATKDYEIWYKRGKEAGLTNPRDLAEFAATKGQKMPSGGSSGATKQWVLRPGSEEPELAFVNKNDPSGYVDVDGKSIPGAKAVATPTQERLYGAIQGYYHYWRGKGLGDKEAKAKAGEDYRDNLGKHLGRLEQQANIDAALSGVGIGPGFINRPALAAGTAPGTPRTTTPPLPPPRVPAKSTGTTTSATAPLRASLNPHEQEDVMYYLTTITGGAKSVPKAAQVRVQNGQRALSKLTGLDPMALAAELSEMPALAKQLGETIQRAGAIQRLNNTIERHGAILEGVAKNVAQTGSPFLNLPVREWKRKAVGSEELKRFVVALNELQREYAYLTAGGAQSKAMLPVHTSESMDKILSEDSTLAEIIAAVDQIRTGAKTEQEAMKKTQEDIKESMRTGKIGQAISGAPSGSQGNQRDPLGILR
jgi:hypothetical protein